MNVKKFIQKISDKPLQEKLVYLKALYLAEPDSLEKFKVSEVKEVQEIAKALFDYAKTVEYPEFYANQRLADKKAKTLVKSEEFKNLLEEVGS